jgi:2-polyprenyl-6-hydroxyphenyl methylase/3-demethylubiquinone-9 3-methyltransferase
VTDHDRKYFYDTIATDFDQIMNPYDIGRRLDIVFNELLAPGELAGKRVLDVGAGTGRFSEQAGRSGARVTATDIGTNLLRQIRRRSPACLFASDACDLALAPGSFDVVISSECIEHTPDPLRAVREMCRVLRRPGVLVLTTPNAVWHFSAVIAERFKLRPYQGLENWVGWKDLRTTVESEGLTVAAMRGFHLVPPLFKPLWSPLRAIDRYGRFLGPLMLNVSFRAEKR